MKQLSLNLAREKTVKWDTINLATSIPIPNSWFCKTAAVPAAEINKRVCPL